MNQNNQLSLRPSYWASVSGGKDSLYMLNLILHNLDRYPLDGVVYQKYGFPTRKARWCNDKYKLDALKQLREFMLSKGCYIVNYIGYCADELNRVETEINKKRKIYIL